MPAPIATRRRGIPPLPVPDDFAALAPTMSINEMQRHYQRAHPTIGKWLRAAGVSSRGNEAIGPKSLPADFAQHAHLGRDAVAKHYGVGIKTANRWRKEFGVARTAPKSRVKPAKREPKPFERAPKPVTRANVKGTAAKTWGVSPVAAVAPRDSTSAGSAAEALRRADYRPVCRARTLDPKADADLWVVGRRRLTTAEMIDLSARYGVLDQWAGSREWSAGHREMTEARG